MPYLGISLFLFSPIHTELPYLYYDIVYESQDLAQDLASISFSVLRALKFSNH